MRRWLKRLLWLVAGMALLLVLGVTWLLRGSLPALDGEAALPGLSAAVGIERDALGVVTVDAGNEADAMRALGYVHAQERYFEMDLMRRAAAGELAELFGPKAVEMDRGNRVHRLRARARAHLETAAGDKLPVLQAYRDGVNAGLADLRARPWPYLLLRQRPQPWELEDSVLAGLSMYADLQDAGNRNELAMARIRGVLPAPLLALLEHDGSQWDAPLFGPPRGDAVLPDAATLDLRQLPAGTADTATPPLPETDVVGSNNFAVAGALTADGRAILADDMHLGLRAPNIWFRARLRYADTDAPGGKVDVAGFTLPGLPAVIVGSNGHVAWGFTNAYIDNADFARIPPAAPGRRQDVLTRRETIRVAGAAPVPFEVRETAWGPVLHEEADGSLLALRWSAQLPGAVKLDFADMARAADLDAALAVADRAGIPAQNLLLADRNGRIAWRIIGARPDRQGSCTADGIANTADSAAEAAAGTVADPVQPCLPWSLRSDRAPALIDPPEHRLWTANNRVVDGQVLQQLGNAGYDLGARGRQIRDALYARERFTEQDLLAIQLDDRALLLERWWQLLRQTVEHGDDPALRRLEAASRDWDGHAAVDSVSYRLARGFRGIVLDTLEAGLLAPAQAALGEDYLPPKLPQLEGIAWPLLQQRPAHLLPPPFASWDELLADSARRLEADLSAQGGDLGQRTWGERNTAAICHPVARALPGLAKRWLCAPAQPLPGDRDMPRVQAPAFGASQRMVVAPGHEQDGIVHMPGGQSGHPLSPFWNAGHRDWVEGRPTPFLPGTAQHTLRLQPR
ncbi:penicillin acylase family protein [Flavobacterium sp. MXW15]|uniref:Penicillin acylase family protein n=1 Tax=Xanthomonas chitinilytica TaxID=2989819 RepID=A0ABT3JV52_9XANT|nr:penicillin acylase family protein [Xanthomonas sp. H13-6]MCW4453296.1 penicillin acylase family protein [Flavobacterium sp. MXW15]MCW4472351.1 penicillin acylase family protein [Xanthomonas sp. H13-6]